jgi:glucose uptake protein GlcU
MKSNVGNIDRAIRIVVAVIIGILYFTNQINGTAAIILGIIAIAFLVTGFVRFCPGYLPFNFSTKKKSEAPPAE